MENPCYHVGLVKVGKKIKKYIISKCISASSANFNGSMAKTGNFESDASEKQLNLQKLIQLAYMAQADVQIEASEIQKSEKIADVAKANLEEEVNNVRIITAALNAGQENIAANAVKAQLGNLKDVFDEILITSLIQTANLQLAAHDKSMHE